MKPKISPSIISQIIIYTLISTSAFADDEIVGNGAGEALSSIGPKATTIHLSECKFSITLEESQHITFNDPDIIIYENISPSHIKNHAYLWQAETASGYNWQFRTKGSPSAYWFGSICGDTLEFPESFIGKITEEPSTELELIRQSNETHCPAKYINGIWHPNTDITKSRNYVFKELNGENWSGFAIGLKPDNGNEFETLKFCLVHSNKVLIGASENDTPLSLPADSFQKLLRSLSKIRFAEE